MQSSVQKWLPFQEIYEDGVIKLKDNTYIKILIVKPINFNLKSEFEKKSILSSYKLFLKTCNFDIQILIQSNKEDIKKYTKIINENKKNESEKIKNIINKYCQELNEINEGNIYSSKKFFIVIKKELDSEDEDIVKEELNNNFFKIKECLLRCGNEVIDISKKTEVITLLNTFFNKKY